MSQSQTKFWGGQTTNWSLQEDNPNGEAGGGWTQFPPAARAGSLPYLEEGGQHHVAQCQDQEDESPFIRDVVQLRKKSLAVSPPPTVRLFPSLRPSLQEAAFPGSELKAKLDAGVRFPADMDLLGLLGTRAQLPYPKGAARAAHSKLAWQGCPQEMLCCQGN